MRGSSGRFSEKTFDAGAYVCRKGESVDHWIGIVDGLVKMASLSPAGKLTTFTGLPAGAWFGEGSLLKDEPRKYDVIALRASRVALMPRATFAWLLDNSIPFNRFLLLQLNERLGQFIGLVEYDRLLDVEARVARCLASLFNPYLYPRTGMELAISQEEIGYLSGHVAPAREPGAEDARAREPAARRVRRDRRAGPRRPAQLRRLNGTISGP